MVHDMFTALKDVPDGLCRNDMKQSLIQVVCLTLPSTPSPTSTVACVGICLVTCSHFWPAVVSSLLASVQFGTHPNFGGGNRDSLPPAK